MWCVDDILFIIALYFHYRCMSIIYSVKRTIINRLRSSGLMSFVNRLNNLRLWLIKKYCLFMGKNPLERVYDDAFFRVADWEYVLRDSPKVFAEFVASTYHPKSVVDVGCGGGFYAREFVKLSVEILGIDGSLAALRNSVIDAHKFMLQDVTKRFVLPKRYDCALCFEVGEHVSTASSETLVSNLIRVSDLIFFAAAQKGQGGHDHINEQSADFWIKLFNSQGYDFLEKDTLKFKKHLKDHQAIFWLTDNILVFRRVM